MFILPIEWLQTKARSFLFSYSYLLLNLLEEFSDGVLFLFRTAAVTIRLGLTLPSVVSQQFFFDFRWQALGGQGWPMSVFSVNFFIKILSRD